MWLWMMNNLNELFEAITTDFSAFTKYCITIPARDWRSPPSESTIKDMPFVLAEHQQDFLEYLESDLEDKVVLKCRQKGFSIMMLAYCLWRVLYGRNEKIMYMIDSLGKCTDFRQQIRNMYDSIPDFLKPKGIDILATNRIQNLVRNNVVYIGTAKGEKVRSGTFTMVVLDEFAFYDESVQVDIAAAINSSCPHNRVWISTPKQEDDIYHDKVKAAKAQDVLFEHNYFDYYESWFGSEENAKAWRAVAEKGLSQAAINRELDCKFSGAAEDLVWYTTPEMFRRVGLPKESTPVIVAMDLGWADDTAILFARDYGHMLYVFDELVVNETTIPAVAQMIKGRGYRIKYGIMDAAGKKVDQTSGVSSWQQMQQRLGCRFLTRKTDKVEMLRVANSAMLESQVYIDPDGCPLLVKMFNNYEWAGMRLPHNKYSHIHDAFVYLVYNHRRRGQYSKSPVRFINRSQIKRI